MVRDEKRGPGELVQPVTNQTTVGGPLPEVGRRRPLSVKYPGGMTDSEVSRIVSGPNSEANDSGGFICKAAGYSSIAVFFVVLQHEPMRKYVLSHCPTVSEYSVSLA